MPPVDDATTAVFNTTTDAVLWYDVGLYGKLGYGVPNASNDIGSLNPNIIDLTNLIGRNLFLVMHHEDTDLSSPPSVNTLLRIHQLYKRCAQIITARAIAPGTPNLETEHVTPAGEVFRVWPIPYFKVRNTFLKRSAGWIMILLGECFQHNENRKSIEISTTFGAMVGKYMDRVYRGMAMEMFGKTLAEASAPNFLLQPADFTAYNPSAYFTSTEMIDPVPALDNVLTEDRKAFLHMGIPLTELPKLKPYPTNLTNAYARMRTTAESTANPDTAEESRVNDGSRIGDSNFPQPSTFI